MGKQVIVFSTLIVIRMTESDEWRTWHHVQFRILSISKSFDSRRKL